MLVCTIMCLRLGMMSFVITALSQLVGISRPLQVEKKAIGLYLMTKLFAYLLRKMEKISQRKIGDAPHTLFRFDNPSGRSYY